MIFLWTSAHKLRGTRYSSMQRALHQLQLTLQQLWEWRTVRHELFKTVKYNLNPPMKCNPITGKIKFTAEVKEPAVSLLDSLLKRRKGIKQIKMSNSRKYIYWIFHPVSGRSSRNHKNKRSWASLVAQWLRIFLPMQGTRVRVLVREDPTCRGATKPMCHNYWAHVPQLLSPCAATTEARAPRARTPQEKPPQWEARAPQRRVAPARRN